MMLRTPHPPLPLSTGLQHWKQLLEVQFYIPLLGELDQVVQLDAAMDNLGDGGNYAFFNNITYTSPKVPTLYTALSAGDLAASADLPAVPHVPRHPGPRARGQRRAALPRRQSWRLALPLPHRVGNAAGNTVDLLELTGEGRGPGSAAGRIHDEGQGGARL
ncbi:hypothetical protein DL771_007916 [Monosporascus sp. 5C6A]|nr:hypothetical protein DL771_007916 [Monosporascus sp. 5C6A]